MNSTIDGAGRIVIPKVIRDQAGLEPGTRVTVRYDDGRVEIEPAREPMKLVKKGPLTVLVPEGKPSPLTPGVVEEVRDQLRRERGLTEP